MHVSGNNNYNSGKYVNWITICSSLFCDKQVSVNKLTVY